MKHKKKEGWSIEFCSVTPDDAKAVLESMTDQQRTPSEASIRNLVSEITEGNFGISNDAWVRTQSGVWLNCQHRANAIARTGATVEVVVMTVPDDAARTILRIMDCGVTRSVAHVAQMMSGVKNAAIVSAVARTAMAMERGLLTVQGCYANTNRTAQDRYISRDALLDYIKAHAKQLEESAAIAKKLNDEFGIFGTNLPAFVHYIITRKYSAKLADAFLAVLSSGKGEKDECVEPLRKAMIKEMRSIRKSSLDIKRASIMRTFVSWNHGTIPTRGFIRVDEPLPKI